MKLLFGLIIGGIVVAAYIMLLSYGLNALTDNVLAVFLGAVISNVLFLALIIGTMAMIEMIVNAHRKKIREGHLVYHGWLLQLGLLQTVRITNKKVKQNIRWFT